MKTLQVRLPDSVHGRLKELASKEGVSLNQMLVSAASNEVTRQETREFFQGARSNFDPVAFAEALAAVSDAAPLHEDEMPLAE